MDDNVEERELKLHRDSNELLNEFESRLPSLLWKHEARGHRHKPPEASRFVQRSTVSRRDLNRLVELLEPFQEWPQLLDRRLGAVVKPLIEAFLTGVSQQSKSTQNVKTAARDTESCTVMQSLSRLLYVLCKIRGQKVITQLFTCQPLHLEMLLDAFQSWSRISQVAEPGETLSWEERYIMLSWLSHLLLVPFDLASMSSDATAFPFDTEILEEPVHSAIPLIARRLLLVSISNMASASKEREAATVLMLSLLLRSDMQAAGLTKPVISWCLSQTNRKRSQNIPLGTDFLFMSISSLLASFIKSAPSPVIQPHFVAIAQDFEQTSRLYSTSTVSQKAVIKGFRSLAIKSVKVDVQDDEVLETVIGSLIEKLAASDTSVRFAASKGLAMIAAQIPSVAEDIFEVLLADLDDSIGYHNPSAWVAESSLSHQEQAIPGFVGFDRDWRAPVPVQYSNVNGIRWHGIVLTLAQFAMQRSIPHSLLQQTTRKLVSALSFEQKSNFGSSTGANVRDAALFGLWALARKYSTRELCDASPMGDNLLQALACQLVVTASLDPVGNIRRGASAALQETIGRHPDTIDCGKELELVHIVDYHAVATRAKAMSEVAPQAASVNRIYLRSLMAGLLSWRGLFHEENAMRKDSAAQYRREAAVSYSRLTLLYDFSESKAGVKVLLRELKHISRTSAIESHGLLYALAEITLQLHLRKHTEHAQGKGQMDKADIEDLWNVVLNEASQSPAASSSRSVQEAHEALAALIKALADLSTCTRKPCDLGEVNGPDSERLVTLTAWISDSMRFQHAWSCPNVGAETGEALMKLIQLKQRAQHVGRWVKELKSLQGPERMGVIATLAATFKTLNDSEDNLLQKSIIEAILNEMMHTQIIERRAHSILCLNKGILNEGVCTPEISQALNASLQDYTIDQRGDIGSLVRVEAIDSAAIVVSKSLLPSDGELVKDMIAQICGLATEKLDRVRFRAARCLQEHWKTFGLSDIQAPKIQDLASVSDVSYFTTMLSLTSQIYIRLPLLRCFITSAGGGSDSLIQSSRTALINYTSKLADEDLVSFCNAFVDIFRDVQTDERLVIPTMEVVSFLLDIGLLQHVDSHGFPFKTPFHLTAKSHYKSTKIPKIEAAVRIYRGLALIPHTRTLAMDKLISMLQHRYAAIRNAAADALLLVLIPSTYPNEHEASIMREKGTTSSSKAELGSEIEAALLEVNWSDRPSALDKRVQRLREVVGKLESGG